MKTTQLSIGEGTSNQETKLTLNSLIISQILKIFSEFHLSLKLTLVMISAGTIFISFHIIQFSS
jgi:hypothetical protein